MRIFLDTNVLVSAVATRGICPDVLRETLTSHHLVISDPLLIELQTVLQSKFDLPDNLSLEFTGLLKQDAIVSGSSVDLDLDTQDTDDILILSTAINGDAEIFVTGDKELLKLGKVQHLDIISPRTFWELLISE